MSADQEHKHDAKHDGDHDHDAHHEEHDEGGHGSLRGYATGFLLSVVLTAIPFWLVMSGGVGSSGMTALVILGFAAVQIVVHMIYFLHMNAKSENGWSILALIFTLVLVVILLAGSLWVMFHLNTNMMPMAPHDMRNMP
jgi:cytochrome o ubiquinol oxidase subunit IV